jgi:hypothetical protein
MYLQKSKSTKRTFIPKSNFWLLRGSACFDGKNFNAMTTPRQTLPSLAHVGNTDEATDDDSDYRDSKDTDDDDENGDEDEDGDGNDIEDYEIEIQDLQDDICANGLCFHDIDDGDDEVSVADAAGDNDNNNNNNNNVDNCEPDIVLSSDYEGQFNSAGV